MASILSGYLLTELANSYLNARVIRYDTFVLMTSSTACSDFDVGVSYVALLEIAVNVVCVAYADIIQ